MALVLTEAYVAKCLENHYCSQSVSLRTMSIICVVQIH